MKHLCMYCGADLPSPPGEDPKDQRVSHGICDTCLESHYPDDPDDQAAIEKPPRVYVVDMRHQRKAGAE